MKETPWRRIAVTSPFNEISMYQLGKGVAALLRLPPSLSPADYSGQMFKDDVNGFSSTSDICFYATNILCTELEFLKQSMGVRNRVGIELSYQPIRLHRMAEFIPWNQFLGSINV
jgi:hypothetical protein